MKEIYRNIAVMLIGLSLIAWFFEITILFYVVLGLAALSIIPVCAKSINWIWMKLAMILGWINSRILLSVVYIFILVPLAMFSRMFKKDPLRLKRNPEVQSYYELREQTFTRSDLENPW